MILSLLDWLQFYFIITEGRWKMEDGRWKMEDGNS
jgi:hypothetical protein